MKPESPLNLPQDDILSKCIVHYLSHVGMKNCLQLKQNLQERGSCTIRFATGCSGTDVFSLAVSSLQEVLSASFGCSIVFEHVFSVEVVAWKQDFIRRHFRPSAIFSDITSLLDGFSVDVTTNEKTCIPHVDWWIAGFECDSVSSLNLNRKDNKACVAVGEEKTGRTAQGVLDYIRLRLPAVVILENVKAINNKDKNSGRSNLDELIHLLNGMGYLVSANPLQAHNFGAPQMRERYYIIACRASCSPPCMQTDPKFQAPAWLVQLPATLLSMQGIPPVALQEFLLPDGHPRLQKWQEDIFAAREKETARRGAQPADSCGVGAVAEPKWEVDHLDLFRAAMLRWPPQLPPELEAAVRYLPRRAQELVYYYTFRGGGPPYVGPETVHDVNMSASWESSTQEACPCIVCSSTLWLRTLRRELYGGEALAIQGFRHSFQKIEEMRLSQTNLMDLAGNAFSAFCVVPVVLATLVHYPWPEICITDDDGGWSSSASAADQVEDRGCTDISNGSAEDENIDNMCQSPPPKARKLV